MELSYILAILYWIGYAIVFTIILAVSVKVFLNKEELKKQGQELSVFNMLFILFTVPVFSWLAIIILILSYYFSNSKSN